MNNRLARYSLLGLILALWFVLVAPVGATVLDVDTLDTSPLGRSAGLLEERTARLTPEQALALARDGSFVQSSERVPKFGIGSHPVWLHLRLYNPQEETLQRTLMLGVPWLDRMDVHVLHLDRVIQHLVAGDAHPDFIRPLGSIGYAVGLELKPGISELLIRVESVDPLAIPLRLLDAEATGDRVRWHHFGYGLLYGFLLALIGYNTMLYFGLRKGGHLDYALYLGCFLATSLAYSGNGYAWIWGGHSEFQRYVILVLMVLYGVAGLRFADRFLDLPRISPATARGVRVFSGIGIAAIAFCVLAQLHATAVFVAFVFVLAFAVTMVGLGILCVQRGQVAAYYFLSGAVFAMIGVIITALSVWHGLPFETALFHAAEAGAAIEGTLLALALAYRMRSIQSAHLVAEKLSRTDPLTGLLNRRAFADRGEGLWSTATRNDRPLSMVLLDLDHFKQLNDQFGHTAGDDALKAVATVLKSSLRRGDIAARWGGEEFILLLPETDAAKAHALAERLLGDIRAIQLTNEGHPIALSASLGVATRDSHARLEEMIREADKLMYHAKQSGRARVSSRTANSSDSALSVPDKPR